MKLFEEHTIQNGRLMALLLIVLSCSSNKDIYRNPYQSSTNVNPGIPQEITQQHPDWIYAVSKDFVVGCGYGKDIIEAKNAALNDIKAFIIKSLGETGNCMSSK